MTEDRPPPAALTPLTRTKARADERTRDQGHPVRRPASPAPLPRTRAA
ncbi:MULTISPECIES: hypothetical protein [Streptomyces]|nr:hypothetical protein [Streptomyces sp. NEAU-HV9]